MRRAVRFAAVLATATAVFAGVAAVFGAGPAQFAGVAAAFSSPAHGKLAGTPQHRNLAAGNVRNFLLDLGGQDYNWATVAPQYHGIAVNAWDSAWRAQIRAASPGTKVYVYKSLIDTRSNDCGTNPAGGSSCIVGGTFCPAGVHDAPDLADGMGFCWAWRHHRNWFLRNTSGNLIQLAGFPDSYLMNFGNAAYQRAWLSNVAASARAGRFQGVFADNAIITTGYGVSARYPTNAAVQAAMSRMLATVGPGLRNLGFRVLPNLGDINLYPGLWGRWLHYVSGFLNEFWGFWPGNSAQSGWYQWTTKMVKACAAQNKVCVFHAGDRSIPLSQAQRNYVTATLLLFTNGRQLIAYAGDSPPAPQTRLGAATGRAYRTSDGVWHRHFACGRVTVDPAGDGARGTGSVTVTC